MRIQPYVVALNLPEKLAPLRELAMNVYFGWDPEVIELFLRLDAEALAASGANPVATLGRIPHEKLEEAARDAAFVERVRAVHARLKNYLSKPGWFSGRKIEGEPLVAYFSMEFGLHESIPIYSGGLGVLAGDHLKCCSDLGVPLVGVGLLYQRGYFRQYLNLDGWQQETYPENDWFNMPVSVEKREDGQPVTVEVELGAEKIVAQVWRVNVGRTALYLLDTNLPENPARHRKITASLYGGDRDMRLRQEIVLGIGGVRALKALGLSPTVYHMNEGHSAFLAVERLRALTAERGLNIDQAKELVWATTVFTTHTPVPAGHEVFDPKLMKGHLESYARAMGLDWDDFLALGMEEKDDAAFSMTALGLRTSALCNGVSALHGHVSRRMFHHLWPTLPLHEVPIGHVTNGVHVGSWISHNLRSLFERRFGAEADPAAPETWARVAEIPAEELWQLRRLRRRKLVEFVRERLTRQLKEKGADANAVRAAEKTLDPDALTIGFARRFAAYKRATLLLNDPDRLVKLLTDSTRPVQFIFAGKSHPHDKSGKELIRSIHRFSQDPRIAGRVVFLDDYDIHIARYMVQGVDVWLNNPRRPMEASGTSGMKAVLNGALHASTLDGWWAEGYDPRHGFAIGGGEAYEDPEEGDKVEAEALHTLLEQEIVPIFFDRDAAGLPADWMEMVKRSMIELGRRFGARRMILDYLEKAYLPAHRARMRLTADESKEAKELAAWRVRVDEAWPKVSLAARQGASNGLKTGATLPVHAHVRLGGLLPEDVAVEVYYGRLSIKGAILAGKVVRMTPDGVSGGEHRFRAEIPLSQPGRNGFSVRVRPDHPALVHAFTPFRLTWD